MGGPGPAPGCGRGARGAFYRDVMLLLNIMYPGLPLTTGAVVRQGGVHKRSFNSTHLCLTFSVCLFCPDFNNHPNIWISSQRPCACVEARGCAVLLRAGPPWSGAGHDSWLVIGPHVEHFPRHSTRVHHLPGRCPVHCPQCPAAAAAKAVQHT